MAPACSVLKPCSQSRQHCDFAMCLGASWCWVSRSRAARNGTDVLQCMRAGAGRQRRVAQAAAAARAGRGHGRPHARLRHRRQSARRPAPRGAPHVMRQKQS